MQVENNPVAREFGQIKSQPVESSARLKIGQENVQL